MCDKVEGISEKSAIGLIPSKNGLILNGLEESVDMKAIFDTPKEFWMEEIEELRDYFATQVGDSLPKEIINQLDALEKRF